MRIPSLLKVHLFSQTGQMIELCYEHIEDDVDDDGEYCWWGWASFYDTGGIIPE